MSADFLNEWREVRRAFDVDGLKPRISLQDMIRMRSGSSGFVVLQYTEFAVMNQVDFQLL